jgi:hypothetical protein
MDKFERELQKALSDVQNPKSELGLDANLECAETLFEKAKQLIGKGRFSDARKQVLNITVVCLDIFDRLTEMAMNTREFRRAERRERRNQDRETLIAKLNSGKKEHRA